MAVSRVDKNHAHKMIMMSQSDREYFALYKKLQKHVMHRGLKKQSGQAALAMNKTFTVNRKQQEIGVSHCKEHFLSDWPRQHMFMCMSNIVLPGGYTFAEPMISLVIIWL